MNVFLELHFGLWLGRATRGAKPLVVFTGFILVFVGIALMIAISVAVWHYASQAAHLVEWSGIGKYLPFLDSHVHEADGNDVLFLMQKVPSRLVLCTIALLVTAAMLAVASRLLGLVLNGVGRS